MFLTPIYKSQTPVEEHTQWSYRNKLSFWKATTSFKMYLPLLVSESVLRRIKTKNIKWRTAIHKLKLSFKATAFTRMTQWRTNKKEALVKTCHQVFAWQSQYRSLIEERWKERMGERSKAEHQCCSVIRQLTIASPTHFVTRIHLQASAGLQQMQKLQWQTPSKTLYKRIGQRFVMLIFDKNQWTCTAGLRSIDLHFTSCNPTTLNGQTTKHGKVEKTQGPRCLITFHHLQSVALTNDDQFHGLSNIS